MAKNMRFLSASRYGEFLSILNDILYPSVTYNEDTDIMREDAIRLMRSKADIAMSILLELDKSK